MQVVHALNEAGCEVFAGWIADPNSAPPTGILFNPQFADPEPENFNIDVDLGFATSFELGRYLCEDVFVGVRDRFSLRARSSMWAWLSLAFIGSLMSRDRGKGVRPLARAHYIDGGKRQSYRLIARTAWELFFLHGQSCRIALSSKGSPWGEMAEQMTGATQENFSHQLFWSLANALFVDEEGAVRRGAASKRSESARRNPMSRSGLGSVRRLAITMRQFDRTYNTREMSLQEVSELLPTEYRHWLAAPVANLEFLNETGE